MTTPDSRILVLGGGPAGMGAAFRLRQEQKGSVSVVEQHQRVGGNAGSFELADHPVDFGSHRLHPACDPRILQDIKDLLGDDLKQRPRYGRIRLRGQWIGFPLKPINLLFRSDWGFASGVLRDMLTSWTRADSADENFASVLRAKLGPTICESFYFPYAHKIWGCSPDELSAVQARRRVAANSFGKLVRKILGQLPGVKPVGYQFYYYPHRGFGQITEAYAEKARELGAELLLGARVEKLRRPTAAGSPWTVVVSRGDGEQELEADHVWSTLPLTVLARMMDPGPPATLLDAARSIHFRAMVLVYLVLDVEQFTPFDAHYFPESEVRMTRMSEPKNYRGSGEPRGQTVLCAEIPCARDDAVWNLGSEDLARLVAEDLDTAGIPLPVAPSGTHVVRLPYAYPIYRQGYEAHYDGLIEWLESQPGLLSFGRQGLFAHDNTHHALAMAYAAVECLSREGFDHSRWAAYREDFQKHVVED